MTTVVQVFDDEQSVLDDSPVAVIVLDDAEPIVVEVADGSPVQTTDPLTGKPYAVMAVAGRNIYVAQSPPTEGQFDGDLFFRRP